MQPSQPLKLFSTLTILRSSEKAQVKLVEHREADEGKESITIKEPHRYREELKELDLLRAFVIWTDKMDAWQAWHNTTVAVSSARPRAAKFRPAEAPAD